MFTRRDKKLFWVANPLHVVIRAHLDRKIVNAMLFLIACKHSHLHAVTCLTNSVDANNLRMQAHEGFLVNHA